jgi:hypothetical protein
MDEGYDIGAVGTAEDGLKQLAATPFHLVITDHWLPWRRSSPVPAAEAFGRCADIGQETERHLAFSRRKGHHLERDFLSESQDPPRYDALTTAVV